MARTRTKVTKETVPSSDLVEPTEIRVPDIGVALITHEFGNGDMNVLRDKINEIIKHIN